MVETEYTDRGTAAELLNRPGRCSGLHIKADLL